jgi:hypothetical protein
MAAPLPAKLTFETVRITESISRFVLALIGTVAYFLLLFVALVWRPDSFQAVAAATSGVVGAAWGYYFGRGEK